MAYCRLKRVFNLHIIYFKYFAKNKIKSTFLILNRTHFHSFLPPIIEFNYIWNLLLCFMSLFPSCVLHYARVWTLQEEHLFDWSICHTPTQHRFLVSRSGRLFQLGLYRFYETKSCNQTHTEWPENNSFFNLILQ